MYSCKCIILTPISYNVAYSIWVLITGIHIKKEKKPQDWFHLKTLVKTEWHLHEVLFFFFLFWYAYEYIVPNSFVIGFIYLQERGSSTIVWHNVNWPFVIVKSILVLPDINFFYVSPMHLLRIVSDKYIDIAHAAIIVLPENYYLQ